MTIATLGDFGLLEGLGFAHLADYYDQDQNTAAAATILVGSAAGLAAGSVLASHRHFTYGDANVMRDAGVLGAFASQMVTDWFNPDEDKTYVTAAMIGGVVGLAAGDRLVRDTEFKTGQSVMVSLGMVSGAALGLGVGYVSSGSRSENGTFLLTSSMLGSALGFVATYRSFLPSARVARTKGSSWNVEVSPLSLMATAGYAAGGRGGSHGANLPLVRVNYRF